MAIIKIDGAFYIPRLFRGGGNPSAPSAGNFATLTAAGDKIGFVFQAPEAGAIRRIGFRTGTIANATRLDVKIESLDVTGLPSEPSGALLAAGAEVEIVIPAASDNMWLTTAPLIVPAAVAKGEWIALVFERIDALGGASRIISFQDDERFPSNYGLSDIAGSGWVADTSQVGLCAAVEYSGGTYAHIHGLWPFNVWNSTTFNSGSAANQVGLKFSLPFPASITGGSLWIDADGDYEFRLLDAADTILARAIVEGNTRFRNSGMHSELRFDADVELDRDTDYRLVVVPTSVTNVTVYDQTIATAALKAALPTGADFQLTTLTGAVWTDTALRWPWVGLILNGFAENPAAIITVPPAGDPDLSGDIAILDGLEDITLAGDAVAGVYRLRDDKEEAAPSEGGYLHRQTIFHLPPITETPVVGALVVDADSVSYVVLEVRSPFLNDAWFIRVREVAISADTDLTDTITLYPAVVTGDPFGSRIGAHDSADADFTDVPCKIQIQPPMEAVIAGKRQFRRRFKIFVARDIDVSIEGLLKDQKSNWYDILSWFNRERIDELSVIEAEFKD